jgi:putative transposase
MCRRAYPTDLSDAEFACLAPHLPPPKPRGRPWRHARREILDAIFYVVRTGCQWRCLPHEYPPWSTVHCWFRRWRLDGTWERLNTALRERLRVRAGRDPQPSGCILDSQSVKTTSVGGVRGYDGAKKLRGRKRHVLVDTQGLVLTVKVHAAHIQDRAAVPLLLDGVRQRFPRLEHAWVDQGYTGSGRDWMTEHLGWSVEVVRHPPIPRRGLVPVPDATSPYGVRIEYLRLPRTEAERGFRGVLPRRWVVERTFGWFGQSRRLSKDYEKLCETGEALVYATMTRLMARRLARG